MPLAVTWAMGNSPPLDPFADLNNTQLCKLGLACIEDSDDWKARAARKHFKILQQRLEEGRVVDRVRPSMGQAG